MSGNAENGDGGVRIRPYAPADRDIVVAVWQAAVEATHDFVTAEDIRFFREEIRNRYLDMLEVHVAEDGSGQPVGFVGLDGACVEMLFVDPARHGTGIGTRLLAHARALKGPLSLDVNEDNPQARAFYARRGFRVVGRSPRDATGRPYPLLHLAEDG